MSVTPTGPENKPLALLAAMIAHSAAFRIWCEIDPLDADAADQAAARVHLGWLDETDLTTEQRLALRPLAFLCWSTQFTASATQEPDEYFRHSGSVELVLEAAPGTDESIVTRADAMLDFVNRVGAVLEEIEAVSGQAGYLTITAIQRTGGPARTSMQQDAAAEIDVHQVRYQIDWAEN